MKGRFGRKIKDEGVMPNMAKNFLLWAVIAAVLMMVFDNFQNTATDKELSYSEFITAVETNQVEKVTITGQSIVGIERGGNRFETIMPTYDDKLIDTLLANDVQVKGTKPEKQSFLAQLLIASLPIIIRSEERRVGKEGNTTSATKHYKNKEDHNVC